MLSDLFSPGHVPLLLAVLASLGAWIWASRLVRSGAHLFAPLPRPRRRWPFETVAGALIGVFVLPILAAVPFLREPKGGADTAQLLLSISMIQLTVVTGAIVVSGTWSAARLSFWSFERMAVQEDSAGGPETSRPLSPDEAARELTRDCFWGVWTGLAGLVPGYAINMLIFAGGLRDADTPHPLLEAMLTGDGLWTLLCVGFVAVIIAPLLEELQYRAILQGWLMSKYGSLRGILLGALAFAAIHWAPGRPDALPLLPFAVLLGALYAARGSLGANIIAHMTFNAINLTIACLDMALSKPVG